MTRARLSFFVHDLAANPVARAAPLALALAAEHEVELLGFLISGDQVYAPYRDRLPTVAVPCDRRTDRILAAIPKLAARARGDLVYACKPLLPSLGPALWASGAGRTRPLFLDAEDDEWIPFGSSLSSFVWRDLVKGWKHATAWKYTRALHPLTRVAQEVTVASRALQRRYGGTLVLHGPDESVFDPSRSELDGARCREKFRLPRDAPLALFSGVPQPHKGWDVLLDALASDGAREFHLVLAGPPGHPDFARAKERLGARCHPLGLLPNSEMPSLLAASDVVPLPQLDHVYSRSQVSAKGLEAMAMARAVIASRVGDLPEILGDDRGWLCDPGSAPSLARAFSAVAHDPDERVRRGTRARRWFLDNASASAIRARLLPLVDQALAAARRRV
jgi:glycosyltransferase involved in cell wall biosynthesis